MESTHEPLGLAQHPLGWAIVDADGQDHHGLILASDGDDSPIIDTQIVEGGEIVLIASEGGTVWRIDLEGNEVSRFKSSTPVIAEPEDSYASRFVRVVISPSGTIAATGTTSISILDFSQTDPIPVLEIEAGAPPCLAGLSASGEWLAVLSCDRLAPSLEIFSLSSPETGTVSLKLPFVGAREVSVSDDGRTVAVAFFGGEVAIVRDGKHVPALELSKPGSDHSMFIPGWASLSPSGRWLVTRRDGDAVELWLIDDSTIEAVGHLTTMHEESRPTNSQFSNGYLTIGWGQARRSASWPLGYDQATSAACRLLGNLWADPPIDTNCDAPERPPGLQEDRIAAPTTATAADAEGLAIGLFDEEIFSLPEGQYYAMEGTPGGGVWIGAIGSATYVSPSGDQGVFRQNGDHISLASTKENDLWSTGGILLWRLSDGEWSGVDVGNGLGLPQLVHAAGSDLYIAFERSGSPAGQVEICFIEESGRCRSVGQVDPYLADGTRIADMALLPSGQIVLSERAVFRGGKGALHIVDGTNSSRIEVPGDSPRHVAVSQAGDVWFTLDSDEGIGRLKPDGGGIEVIPLPSSLFARDIEIDDEGTIWIATDTDLVYLDAGGAASVLDLRDAAGINQLVVDGDGTLWLLDDANNEVRHISWRSG